MKTALAVLASVSLAAAQRWSDVAARTPAGLVAIDQAARDANADSLVLLVASHPDDRYVLPAIWLRRTYGLRVAVLLATRGGGGQNSGGSESGDALERVRTLEAEVGCAQIGADVWYLDRPDGGFRRSANETYAEWGRDGTLRDLARILRRVRPDAVMTTHNVEEQHGHDLALVELLPEAMSLAADASFAPELPVHAVRPLYYGGRTTPASRELRVDVDRLDRGLGVTLRRHAYEVLRAAHLSPGPPASMDSVFDALLRLEPQNEATLAPDDPRPLGLPTVFDAGRWPGEPARAAALSAQLAALPARAVTGDAPLPDVLACVQELRQLRSGSIPLDAATRLDRRIGALERLALLLAGVQFEVDVPPGTIAVGGEEFTALVRVHCATPRRVRWSVAGLDGVEVAIQELENGGERTTQSESDRASLAIRVARSANDSGDPMAPRFHAARFLPPVRLQFTVQLDGSEIPALLGLHVEQRAPVELRVVPRMLLLPSARQSLQFSVAITRNSQFPVEGTLEVRGAAGYAIPRDHVKVELRDQRSDTFGFEVQAPVDRKSGVDVLRIALAGNRVELPIHKVDVKIAPGLRVGLVRSHDETLPSMLGAGGLGVDWSELSDTDVAVADFAGLDSIVVDVRALRDRAAVRTAFRRLLDFAAGKGHRLVVLYQKDVEFHPPSEGFVGAPFQLQIGKARVTRADAPMHVLLPAHVLMTHPNVIQPADWDGWEQERALYLPSAWASQYEEILEVHDPGQPEERGALLYAHTGDGEYVYCSLSLWRQLKKLHPGAVRLMANLLTPAPRS
jgi:LmbE family N-acetylglucosaminyl deacetylase